jgi:hypothetical protein
LAAHGQGFAQPVRELVAERRRKQHRGRLNDYAERRPLPMSTNDRVMHKQPPFLDVPARTGPRLI